MIDRYAYPEMKALWETAHRQAVWLEIELQVAEAWADQGKFPAEAVRTLRAQARINPQRAEALEGEKPGQSSDGAMQHDLAAFLASVGEGLGEERKYLHYGLTSYDVEDTALGVILRDAIDVLGAAVAELEGVLRERAREHLGTICIGRSHGVHAEPTTFAHKLCVWLDALANAQQRLAWTREMVAVGKISGAVGTYATVPPALERRVCENLGLKSAPVSTQILQRDRHAHYLTTLALLAGSLEQMATEIRNLQRTELGEVEEAFGRSQIGSSAMPHKRNPRISERICGLARLVRGYAQAGLESIALWHERDLTNSACERIALPDASLLTHFMVKQFTEVMRTLVVRPERMRENLERTRGLWASEHLMLALIRSGMTRGDAYRHIQRLAARAWDDDEDFRALVEADADLAARLKPAEIAECFDVQRAVAGLQEVYGRFGLLEPAAGPKRKVARSAK